jgi:hypothetical protein
VVIVAEHIEFRPEFKKEREAEEDGETMEHTADAENLAPSF